MRQYVAINFIISLKNSIFLSRQTLILHLFASFTPVRILSSVKRTPSNDRGVKTYTKRVHYNESQSSLTHIGAPVNPMTAKALATKLNERHNLLHRSENRADQVTSNTFRSDFVKCGGLSEVAPIKIKPQPNNSTNNGKNENGTLDKFNAISSVCIRFEYVLPRINKYSTILIVITLKHFNTDSGAVENFPVCSVPEDIQ